MGASLVTGEGGQSERAAGPRGGVWRRQCLVTRHAYVSISKIASRVGDGVWPVGLSPGSIVTLILLSLRRRSLPLLNVAHDGELVLRQGPNPNQGKYADKRVLVVGGGVTGLTVSTPRSMAERNPLTAPSERLGTIGRRSLSDCGV